MSHRRPHKIIALLLPLGLSACFNGPPADDQVYPYGQPRYGHGGTQSPAPAGPPAPGAPGSPQYGLQGGPTPPPGPLPPGAVAGAPGAPASTGATGQPAPGGAPAPAGSVPGAGATAGTAGTAPAAEPSSTEPPPYGIPVPGKDGMLYSPYKPDAGFIDITTRNADGSTSVLPPGTKIKDPFSGKPILVP